MCTTCSASVTAAPAASLTRWSSKRRFPNVGSDIAPGGSQRFELKYYFDPFSVGVQYAAQLTYKVEKTNAKLEVWIETTPYVNNSRCEVVPASAGRCTAGGLGITFTR